MNINKPTKIVLCALLVVSVMAVCVCPASAQSYSDDFEQGIIDPSWTKTEQYGSIALSTDQHVSGSQSVRFSSSDGGQREIHLNRSFPAPVMGTASVWFYDSAPGSQTLYVRFELMYSGSAVAGVHIQDYDGDFYHAHANGVAPGTVAPRSLGWHLIEIDTASGIVRIDGSEVITSAGSFSFDSVDLNVTGPSWRPNATYYFDDFQVTGADADVIATPDISEVYPGDSVSVDLDIQNADNLYAGQAECSVDPSILGVQSGVFGDFFDPINRLIGANAVDPVAGTWFGAISQRSPAGPLSGDGLFATINYQALAPGTTSIICEVLLSDRDGFELPVSFVGAEIMVLPYASIDGLATYQGRLDHTGIEVTATGPVTRTDTTDVDGNFSLDELRAGGYDVVADAPGYLPVCTTQALNPGDVITLPAVTLAGGDVNDDDVINIGDATLIGNNFGLDVPPGDAAADINADSAVNVQDLAILGGNYELSGCQSW